MKLKLNIWRQKDANDKGRMVKYEVDGISTHWSFLEVLDVLNNRLIHKGEDPVAFDHDCREGICGMCGFMIDGTAHGRNFSPEGRTTVCQLHMHKFKDGDEVTIEPWRAKAFPVIKDLMVNRSSFDKVIQAGGFISVNTGAAPDAHSVLVPKIEAEDAMTAAECIGCGACVASCKNASAMLFVAAKVSHLGNLPQGQPERARRVQNMVKEMDAQGFGNCSNQYECEAACPKGISVSFISQMNREYLTTVPKQTAGPGEEND